MIWKWSTSVKNPDEWHCTSENGDIYIIDKVNEGTNQRYVPVIERRSDHNVSHVNVENHCTTLNSAMIDCVIHYYTNIVKHRVYID